MPTIGRSIRHLKTNRRNFNFNNAAQNRQEKTALDKNPQQTTNCRSHQSLRNAPYRSNAQRKRKHTVVVVVIVVVVVSIKTAAAPAARVLCALSTLLLAGGADRDRSSLSSISHDLCEASVSSVF
jgi:hypothetical protein